MPNTDYILLSNMNSTLSANPGAKQREIATGMGLSLGMTNIVLRKFAAKGWVLVKRLSPRNVRYALTPEGMNELTHRSYSYMRRTFAEVRDCGAAVEIRIAEARKSGYTKVELYGESDIAFIFEWACRLAGLEFVQKKDIPGTVPEGTLCITGERADTFTAERIKALGGIDVFEAAGRDEK
jgi:hypothetical protein